MSVFFAKTHVYLYLQYLNNAFNLHFLDDYAEGFFFIFFIFSLFCRGSRQDFTHIFLLAVCALLVTLQEFLLSSS